MTPDAARSSINSIWHIVAGARGRTLTAEELEELHRQCRVLDEGVPCRPIYNRVAREVCALLTSPELMDHPAASEKVLGEIEALRNLTG